MSPALRSKLFFGMTVVLLFYVFYIGIKNIFRYNTYKIEANQLQTQLNNEETSNHLLSERLTALTHPESKEFLIRKRLRYIQDGEVVYKFIRRP